MHDFRIIMPFNFCVSRIVVSHPSTHPVMAVFTICLIQARVALSVLSSLMRDRQPKNCQCSDRSNGVAGRDAEAIGRSRETQSSWQTVFNSGSCGDAPDLSYFK